MSSLDLRTFEDIATPAIVLDRDGHVVVWNDAQAALLGRVSADVVGCDVCEFLTAESGLRLRDEMARLRPGAAPAHLVLDWRSRAGAATRLALSVQLGASAAGEPAFVIMLGAPAPERGAPGPLQVRYEELVAQASDAIIAVDAGQRIVLFNRGAERIFGWSAEDAIGQPIDILVSPHARARYRAALDAFARGSASTCPIAEQRRIIGLRKNRDAFPVEGDIYRMEGEGATLLALILRDISARKRQENQQIFLAHASQALASSLEYEETLQMVARLAVPLLADCCVVDLREEHGVRRLKVVHVDPKKAHVAAALEGVRVREVETHPVWQALDERRSVLLREISAGYLERVAQDPEHLRFLRELAPVSVISVPLVARDRVLGALSFCSVRPQRVYDEEDLRLAEELARRAALAIDNAHLYALAQRAIRARDEVLGIVAHDLRNPLNTIQLNVMLMLRRLGSEQERMHALVQTIRGAADRANRLIQDLLDVARIEGGSLAVVRAPRQPGDLLGDALEMMRPEAERASVELTGSAQPGMPEIEADHGRMLQVFSNLIGNAIKFTPAGGRVSLDARRAGDDVCFSVSDTGPGIASDHLPHLFDRFWQAQPKDARGAGLGLAIAKAIVEAHGGRIWAESTQGTGSTFFFTVPTSSPRGGHPQET
jgi:PAS domain S-box-containing protein